MAAHLPEGEPTGDEPRGEGERGVSTAPLVAMVVALAMAAATLAAIALSSQGTPTAEGRPGSGPAVRLAARAGLATVGLALRADGLELTAITPQGVSLDDGSLRVRLRRPGGDERELRPRSCGPRCYLAAARPGRGRNLIEVAVATEGQSASRVLFRASWPPGPDRVALLRRTVRAMGRLESVTLRERVSSDPARGFFSPPTAILSGRQLLDTESYAPEGARDVRELADGGPEGFRVLAYAIPAAEIWYELWIGPDGLIHRERIVGPNHLILRSLSGFRER